MFILYAIPIGIVLGLVLGGRIGRLGDLRLRWVPLALLGLLIQVLLFSTEVGSRLGDTAPKVYIASNLLVFAMVLRNVRVPGMALTAVGAASNLVAIIANDGFMPADPTAFASLSHRIPAYTNSAIVVDPAVPYLTDIFALPSWMPAANVFSIGDVLLGAGVALTIALAMRAPATSAESADLGSDSRTA